MVVDLLPERLSQASAHPSPKALSAASEQRCRGGGRRGRASCAVGARRDDAMGGGGGSGEAAEGGGGGEGRWGVRVLSGTSVWFVAWLRTGFFCVSFADLWISDASFASDPLCMHPELVWSRGCGVRARNGFARGHEKDFIRKEFQFKKLMA